MKPDKAPRRRRTPDEARQEILAAAERVFTDAQPDQVGLKDVARAAGVSHALITHYFGTYAGLIEAALERKIHALRAEMLVRLRESNALERPLELLGIMFSALEDPVHLRLMRWLLASERPSSLHAIGLQEQGFKEICRQIILSVTPTPTPELTETIELALLTGVSAAYGYSLMKVPLAGALGRAPGVALDEAIKRTLAGMLETYLHAKLDETLN
ncbi:MAG: TetR/AcrR family transcriptional regulator [Proteobacteria bacterium]|nr:TetR/AcrR family transcriptional regulator [Pseudomonadota bacterium]